MRDDDGSGAPDAMVTGPRFSMSRVQLMWAAMGIVVAIAIASLASSNLQDVYKSQKDFVVGLLASLAGVCFTKAFSRTTEDMALKLIREAPEGRVDAALEEAVRGRLDRRGVFEALAILQRDIEAAQDRLSEYYHAQSQQLEFYKNAPLLRVVVSDLDRVTANAISLRKGLGTTKGDLREYFIPAKDRHQLLSIRRDLRESVGRKNTAYESLILSSDLISPQAWDVFAVMTGDILKAELTLESLLCQHVRFPPEQCLRSTVEYLEAGLRRAKEFQDAIGGTPSPMVFEIMLADLSSAIDALRRVDLSEAVSDAPAVRAVRSGPRP